ncbi:MAG: hypothetical protein AMXMBFR36_09780 [Acidobacteriota bacterium]
MKQQRIALALVASALAAALAAGALVADDADAGRTKLRLMLDRDGAADQLVVDDLGEMEVGETRTFATEAGKPVTVTRDDEGWDLDVDGKKLRVGDHAVAGEAMTWKTRRVEMDGGDGEAKSVVVLTEESDADGPVRIVRRIGPDGGHGHAFAFGGAPLGLSELLIARLEKNDKFLALDEATRTTVLEAIRESAPGPRAVFVGEGGEEGEPGDRVIVLDLVEKHVDEGE